MEQEQTKT